MKITRVVFVLQALFACVVIVLVVSIWNFRANQYTLNLGSQSQFAINYIGCKTTSDQLVITIKVTANVQDYSLNKECNTIQVYAIKIPLSEALTSRDLEIMALSDENISTAAINLLETMSFYGNQTVFFVLDGDNNQISGSLVIGDSSRKIKFDS